MKMEWDKILTNAILTLVTMAFVGAAMIVWKGATTVDNKVKVATESFKKTIDYVQSAVKITQEELNKISSNQTAIAEKVNFLVDRSQNITLSGLANLPAIPAIHENPDAVAVIPAIPSPFHDNDKLNIRQISPDYSRLPRIDYPPKY